MQKAYWRSWTDYLAGRDPANAAGGLRIEYCVSNPLECPGEPVDFPPGYLNSFKDETSWAGSAMGPNCLHIILSLAVALACVAAMLTQ